MKDLLSKEHSSYKIPTLLMKSTPPPPPPNLSIDNLQENLDPPPSMIFQKFQSQPHLK